MVNILKHAVDDLQVKDICRKCGILDTTYNNWNSKYVCMSALELKRLKEAELSQYKMMYVELAHENFALNEEPEREKTLSPREKREAARYRKESCIADCHAERRDEAPARMKGLPAPMPHLNVESLQAEPEERQTDLKAAAYLPSHTQPMLPNSLNFFGFHMCLAIS